MEEGSLTNLTVPELQQECKKRGLRKNGVKAKLIQRLSEYIEKYGPDHIEPTEKVAPAVLASVEKSVIAIHNPHPYMEEYEESLIQGVEQDNTMEDDEGIDSYFPNTRRDETNEYVEDVDTPDSDQPIPYPVPRRDGSEEKVQHNEEEQAASPTYPATGSNIRDARDEAEELTEPIHKSPAHDNSQNGRIVELPTPTEDEGNGFEEEELDSQQKTHNTNVDDADENEGKREIEDDVQAKDDHSHLDGETTEEPLDELSEDVNGALHQNTDDGNEEQIVEDNVTMEGDAEGSGHTENGEEPDEYNEEVISVERDDNMEKEENEYDDHNDRGDENELDKDQEEDRENDEGYEEKEASRRKEVDEDEEYHNEIEDEDDDHGDKDNYEHERVEGEGEEEGREGGVEEMEEIEREEGEVSLEDGEVSREDSEEMQQEEAIEDGEIVLNVEGQNDFDEHHGDDHLDVSIQDEKISDDHEMDEVAPTPKPPKKVVVPVTLKKRISLAASSETLEERAAKRKRRWGSTVTSRKDSDVAISSEFIKKLIPDMKIDAAAIESVPELDYHEDDNENAQLIVDDPVEEEGNTESASPPKIFKGGRNVKVDSGKKITLDKPSNTTNEVVNVESESDAVTPSTPAPPPPKPSVRNYVIDDEVEVQESREKSPSPAINPVSLYLLIKNLVRPFTVNQLKSVISRTGHIQDGGFWINNIKTHCYVKLSTEVEAAATRDALHGLRWPAGSPKLLDIDFAINEHMYKETTGLLGQKPKVVIEIEDKDSDVLITEERKRKEPTKEDPKEKETDRRKKRPPSKEEKGKDKDKKEAGREESPAKLLDDLFRKTKATPCIYWLPLTEEQILKLEESRR